MVLFSPERLPLALALTALAIAFVSASQDIVIDAYRTDVLPEAERGLGAAIFVMGYRIALLVAGALALILADHIGWQTTYLIMAGCMTAGMVGTFFGRSPAESVSPPVNIREAVYGAFRDFLSRPSALSFLLFVILYKVGDAYAGALTTTFLLRGVGFSATDVGVINKGLGLAATVIGALFGGTLMIKMGLFRSLLAFGILQMVSNLSFMVLAWLGKSYPAMVFAVAFENISSGMGTAAFVAFLMTLCNPRYSATQFALLSSLSAIGRVLVAPTAGYLVEGVGWVVFFFLTTLAALPGLILLMRLRQPIILLTGHQERRVDTGPRKGWGG
jgi:PAT family beta-lactamase induction signal transducer AmpG